MLQAIHDALSSSFMRHGFPVLDESAKSWLEEGEEPHDFKAHGDLQHFSAANINMSQMIGMPLQSLQL